MKARRKRESVKGPRPPSVRLPLPRKTEKRHGEGKRYDRRKDREALRRELRRSETETR
jgi:hypothetical protein